MRITNPFMHLICGPCWDGDTYPRNIHAHQQGKERACCWCGRKDDDPKFKIAPVYVKPGIAATSV